MRDGVSAGSRESPTAAQDGAPDDYHAVDDYQGPAAPYFRMLPLRGDSDMCPYRWHTGWNGGELVYLRIGIASAGISLHPEHFVNVNEAPPPPPPGTQCAVRGAGRYVHPA